MFIKKKFQNNQGTNVYIENFHEFSIVVSIYIHKYTHSFRQTIGQVRWRATTRGWKRDGWLASLSYWLADTSLQILAGTGTPHNNRCGVWPRSFVCDNVSSRVKTGGWKLEQPATANFRLTIGFAYAAWMVTDHEA